MVTLIDDGTMPTEWGCYAIDDEGRPAQRNVLISDGVLVGLHVGPACGPTGPTVRPRRATAAARAISTCRWCA